MQVKYSTLEEIVRLVKYFHAEFHTEHANTTSLSSALGLLAKQAKLNPTPTPKALDPGAPGQAG